MLRNRTLLAVSFVAFASYVGTGMIVPVRVLYAEEQGASITIIGAMATAFLVSNFLFQYPMGWVADRWGRKRIMVAGLVLQAIVSVFYLFVFDPLLFVGLRLVEGVASATMLPPARALIADMTAPEKRGGAYGVFNAFVNAGFLLGPGIGSGLATLGYQEAFVASVVARVIALVVVVLLIDEKGTRRAVGQTAQRSVPWRELFSLPLVGAYILVFGDYLYLGLDLTIFPLWMHDHLGASVGVIGLVYVAWGIPTTLLSPVGGRVADRVRRSWLMLAFGAAQVPIYVAYGLMEVAWPVVVLGIVHGAIYAMMQPAVDAHLAAASAEDARGRIQGFYSSVGVAGAFVGANGFSLLYEVNYKLPLFGMGVAFGICVLVGGLIVRASEARGLVKGPWQSGRDQKPEVRGQKAEGSSSADF
jgi:DHA1 family multidrug resistance protein-like MFS transporter